MEQNQIYEHISPVPWHFVTLGFHYKQFYLQLLPFCLSFSVLLHLQLDLITKSFNEGENNLIVMVNAFQRTQKHTVFKQSVLI